MDIEFLMSQDFPSSPEKFGCPIERKSLGQLGMGEKSPGQSRDFELWDSSHRNKKSLRLAEKF